MTFRLTNATVHYGASSYPMDFSGWPETIRVVEGREAILRNYTELVATVGRMTGFPREFNLTHCAEATYDLDNGAKLTLPQRIVAIANGYTLTWTKEPDDERS